MKYDNPSFIRLSISKIDVTLYEQRYGMKYAVSIICLVLLPMQLFSQINHWESIILPGDSWRYLIPTNEPDPNWKNLGFNDASWTTGNSGFGYGDGDDVTEIPNPTLSIYLRKDFIIVDLAAIEELVLNMDFDDAFVAYLNGMEIARSTISGSPPLYNQQSDGLHEALLYQGLTPESFMVNQTIKDNLIQGNNVLAVQVHNQSLTSSDMSALPVLSAGINNGSYNYRNTPSWFTPPLNFTSSDLPIVIVNTNGQTIVDEPKVTANIRIIYNGEGIPNYISDSPNEYYGLCGIEIRGESAQGFPKKSYGFETWDANGNDMDTSFLNFTPEEDFVLYGPYSDKSLLNNVLAMYLGNEFGQYASQTRFVELVINNDYKGIYVLMEKVKRDNGRVDIAKLNPDEISGDDLTGGYIFRIDKGYYDGWHSKYSAYNNPNHIIYYQIYYPDESDIVPEQKAYIQNYMDEFEQAIASNTYRNAKGKHYLNYIDLRTFVDNLIVNELSKNVDAYRLSSYFHKDKDSKGGRIKAGPLWDFNLAFGNGDYCGGDIYTSWAYYDCVGSSPFWWDRMLNEEHFTNALRCRWEELRQTTLHTDNINSYLDSMTTHLSGALERNFQRWPIFGTYVWPNSWFYASSTSHAQVMGYMKDWLENRSIWLDNNLPGVAQDCQRYEEPPYFDTISGIENTAKQVDIYPNPVDDLLNIRSQHIITDVIIYNMLGQPLYREKLNTKSATIDLGAIQGGLYILKIKTSTTIGVRSIIID